ncbi:MAG: peptidoglycan DD-metalloendopeptidase family protein [Betaproteobacteria bacterium]|nr:peptidoglycan DD-metalloendopeptidase family protein [Betaproteobacteria bacterium]
MRMRMRCAVAAGLAVALSGCMVARHPAPVVERKPAPSRVEARPGTYIVKRGDTLYAIAVAHGIDYRDLARWNNITDPAAIEVGQVLLVKDPNAAPAAPTVAAPTEPAPGAAVARPYQAPPPVQGQAMGADGVPLLPPLGDKPAVAEIPPADLITTPQAIKLPYSEAALAQLQETTSAPSAAAATAPAAAPEKQPAPATTDDPDAVNWGWPTKGKVIAGFNENGGPKGVQIAGNLGQAIVASAPGRVVYTGSGLRGYGNLVIIKHNDTYLSAYAHNRSVLVKQGDAVTKGQKIAEMGDSDASRVMLHFEIRRLGKPVDPIKFLPPT